MELRTVIKLFETAYTEGNEVLTAMYLLVGAAAAAEDPHLKGRFNAAIQIAIESMKREDK